MDIFIEQLVAKKSAPRDVLVKLGVFVIIAALCTGCTMVGFLFWGLPFIAFSAFAASIGVIYLGSQFVKGLSVEYEYILTNNANNKELDIDKITGKSKRRRLFTFDLTKVESFGKCSDAPDKAVSNACITVSAHDNTYVNLWELVMSQNEQGKVVLLFNPNEEFVEKLNGVIPNRARSSR